MTTIKDISKETGYSISTVSKALKNSTRISKKAREKIQDVAKRLHYIPNASAINLRTGHTGNIGILVPYKKQNTYYDKLIISIMSACFQLNYQPIFLVTNYDQLQEKKYLQLFLARCFDGLIITTSSLPYSIYKQYETAKRRIVSLEINDSIPFISMDRQSGFEQAIAYAKKHNCQRFASTFSRTPFSGKGARIAFDIISKYDPHYNKRMFFSNCQSYEDGINAGNYFIRLHKKIDCILANGDDIAAGIIKSYQNNKTKLPLIIGENNSITSKMLNIPSLDFHLDMIGEEAVSWVTHQKDELKKIKATLSLPED